MGILDLQGRIRNQAPVLSELCNKRDTRAIALIPCELNHLVKSSVCGPVTQPVGIQTIKESWIPVDGQFVWHEPLGFATKEGANPCDARLGINCQNVLMIQMAANYRSPPWKPAKLRVKPLSFLWWQVLVTLSLYHSRWRSHHVVIHAHFPSFSF